MWRIFCAAHCTILSSTLDGTSFNIQNSIPHKSQKAKAVSETNRAKEFPRGTAGVPESAKEGARGLSEGSDIGLGPGCREFESRHSDQKTGCFRKKAAGFLTFSYFPCPHNAYSFEDKFEDLGIFGFFQIEKIADLRRSRQISPFSNVFCLTTIYNALELRDFSQLFSLFTASQIMRIALSDGLEPLDDCHRMQRAQLLRKPVCSPPIRNQFFQPYCFLGFHVKQYFNISTVLV